MFTGLFAKIAWGALWSRASANAAHDWAGIPRNVKIALLALLAGVAAYFVHQHYAGKELNAAYAKGRADYAAKVEKQAREIEAKAADVANRINQPIRDAHNEELGRIHADADAIRVRGAGAAECRDPRFSAAAGGSQQAGGAANAALPQVLDGVRPGLIAMPVSAAAGFAEQHDAFRDEVIRWHDWWPKMNAYTEELRKQVSDGRQSTSK
jgi:hypothetical protein